MLTTLKPAARSARTSSSRGVEHVVDDHVRPGPASAFEVGREVGLGRDAVAVLGEQLRDERIAVASRKMRRWSASSSASWRQ